MDLARELVGLFLHFTPTLLQLAKLLLQCKALLRRLRALDRTPTAHPHTSSCAARAERALGITP
jgi:hypothetical protein